MPPIKLALILVVSIALQLVLRDVWRPLIYIDFPLIVVVYIALQREAWQALVVATLAGLIVDAQSGGLIGAGGFSKTLTAYVIYFAATKVNLENPLLRIPVLAAATSVRRLTVELPVPAEDKRVRSSESDLLQGENSPKKSR